MDNKLKSKTRLAAIQLVSQHLVNDEDIELIKDDFNIYYRNTKIDTLSDKVKYNINFLSKLVNYYKKINIKNISQEINNLITFDRKFEKWDTVNKAIMLVAISELKYSKNIKYRIVLNDYLEISKSFVNLKDTRVINALLDKLIK